MRGQARQAIALLFLLSALGCALQTPPPATVLAKPSEHRQQMGALAFIAYLGEQVTGSDDEVERVLAPCLVDELARQPLTQKRWTLAWGPAVYKFALAELDDNMLYVVRDADNPAHLTIATRGTNAPAILDWLVEDFDVVDQVAWPVGQPPADAKISKGTSEGLTILLEKMVPEAGPAPGVTLEEFLAADAKRLAPVPLALELTGHSLGGALAPTLALYLKDTQPSWDPTGQAEISVTPLAGPTAGNAAFAAYSDTRLGAATDRLHNPFDIVPLAWNVGTMRTIPKLYPPPSRANRLESTAIRVACDLVRHKGYTQIKAEEPALPGLLNPAATSFVEQVGWQHTCGYRCALGLVEPTFLPVTLDCKTPPTNPCPSCP